MIINNGEYTVYIHTNKINGKRYIGLTKQKLFTRWQHGNGYVDCPKFYNAIKKYGWNMFEHEIFATNLTKEEACNMEKFLIKILDTQKNGYNCFEGGDAPSQTNESKEKLRRFHTGKCHSDETKEKISKAKSGKNHQNFGKHLSEETKKKIGQKNKGKIRSAETLRKLSESHKGYKPQCGKPAKPCICLDTGVLYSTLNEASRQTGIDCNCIRNVCNHKQKTAGKLHWIYATECVTTIESAS